MKNYNEYVLFVIAYDFRDSLHTLFPDEKECDVMYERCIEFAKEFQNSKENRNSSISQYESIVLFLTNKLNEKTKEEVK